MISSIIKLSVSSFVYQILRNDAEGFLFLKGNENNDEDDWDDKREPNINGILNKLIPNLVYYRKQRRYEIHNLLKNDFSNKNADDVYECVNTVIDKIYFTDAELNNLDEVIWFRPSIKNASVFNEIEESEILITHQTVSEYIRGLLNEYSRFPQYKREALVFDDELHAFAKASETGQIFHATVRGKSIRLFAFHYVYGYLYDQGNYLIAYDLTNNAIGAIELYKIKNPYLVERRYKPSQNLINALQDYYEKQEYDIVIPYQEDL